MSLGFIIVFWAVVGSGLCEPPWGVAVGRAPGAGERFCRRRGGTRVERWTELGPRRAGRRCFSAQSRCGAHSRFLQRGLRGPRSGLAGPAAETKLQEPACPPGSGWPLV